MENVIVLAGCLILSFLILTIHSIRTITASPTEMLAVGMCYSWVRGRFPAISGGQEAAKTDSQDARDREVAKTRGRHRVPGMPEWVLLPLLRVN